MASVPGAPRKKDVTTVSDAASVNHQTSAVGEGLDTRDFVDLLRNTTADLDTEPFQMEPYGITVIITEMDAETSARMNTECTDASGKLDALKATEYVLSRAVIYPPGHARAGEPVFDSKTILVLRNKSGRMVSEMMTLAGKLSGLDQAAVEDAKAEFPAEPES